MKLKKHRLTRFARWLELLLLAVWGKKLWILTYSVAIATAYYGSNLDRGNGPDDPKFASEVELKRERGQADAERIASIFPKLEEALMSYQRSLNSFSTGVSPIVDMSPTDNNLTLSFDRARVQSALNDAQDAKRKLSTVIGRVKGCRFESGLFPDLFKGYEDDLRDMQNMVFGYERVLRLALAGDAQGVNKVAGELNTTLMKATEASESLAQRSTDTNLYVRHASRGLEIETERLEFMSTILGVKILIFFFMFTATVLLGVLAFKSRRVTKLYSQNFGGRPDIAKFQRDKYLSKRLKRA